MRIIPVIDLLNGQSVHAVKGERARYRPVKSVLCDSSDPLAVARSYRSRLGAREIYVADLNAIQGLGETSHRDVIAAMAQGEKMDVILDAGISDVECAGRWLDHGARKVVIGSETLRRPEAVREIPSRIGQDRLTFSLDLRNGKILSQCEPLAAMTPAEILALLQQAGWKEVILLDLNRVGSGNGVDRMLTTGARTRFPDLQLLIGGGIAGPEELEDLKSAGIDGVLVATALHAGLIDASCIARLGGSR